MGTGTVEATGTATATATMEGDGRWSGDRFVITVDEYLKKTGLPGQYWADDRLRFLVRVLLEVHRPTVDFLERFLSGSVLMEDGSGPGSTGTVRSVAGEVLEQLISQRIGELLLARD